MWGTAQEFRWSVARLGVEARTATWRCQQFPFPATQSRRWRTGVLGGAGGWVLSQWEACLPEPVPSSRAAQGFLSGTGEAPVQ